MSSHECMFSFCSKRVDDSWALCGEHYRILRDDLRLSVSRAYTPGMTSETASPGLRMALASASSWMAETFAGVADRHDPGRWVRLVAFVRERDAARAQRRATG